MSEVLFASLRIFYAFAFCSLFPCVFHSSLLFGTSVTSCSFFGLLSVLSSQTAVSYDVGSSHTLFG